MQLYIGGYAQGKLAYVQEKLKAFDELKKEAGEGLFEQLIQETMLDNPHSAVVLGIPKKGLTTQGETAFTGGKTGGRDRAAIL